MRNVYANTLNAFEIITKKVVERTSKSIRNKALKKRLEAVEMIKLRLHKGSQTIFKVLYEKS